MVNIPIIPPATEIHTELLPDISQTWKVGQVLNATVERGGENLDKILLRIGQQILESKTPLPLKTGEQIKVLVKALGEAPLLSIITQPTTAQLAASQLRPFINQQPDWKPLIDIALKLLAGNQLPAIARPVLQNLIQQIPDAEQLSQPNILRQLIERSGVMLETHLARRQDVNIEKDFKALLQQLDKVLQSISPVAGRTSHSDQAIRLIETYIRNPQLPLPVLAQELGALINPADMRNLLTAIEAKRFDTPLTTAVVQLFAHIQKQQGTAALEQLLRLISDQNNIGELKTALTNAVSHISQQQLLPLLREADSALLLLFGLPVRHDNETHWINFRIEREKTSSAQAGAGWHVTLNFDIAALGPMQAKLHLQGKQLTTLFRASNNETQAKIRQHLPLLQQALQRSGIEVLKLDVVAGNIETPQPIMTNVHILDEQA
ncbi:MAG: flagellar hook-length control protein FliK [Gammaproteobacteria bacterium]|jgi:Flagellar hook-length control protein FliK|nr:flagellar hook-length control protein FliK [Gammaproteobacteria bacterium]